MLLPVATLLNGLGLVMIHRLGLANGQNIGQGAAVRQLALDRRRCTGRGNPAAGRTRSPTLGAVRFTFGLAGIVLLLRPVTPILGRNINGCSSSDCS